MLPLMSLEAAGTEYGADNPEVMGKIVRSRMLPIAMTAPHDTGTLLFSDSPEYADKDGILYVDKVKGDTRLYFYHVNQANYPRKIVVMAYNPSTSEVSAGVSGVYYAKPSTSYYDVGKDLSTLYYEGNATYNRVSVPPLGYAILSDRLNRVIVAPDQLFSGIVNMDLPEDMYVSAVIMPAAADPVTFMKKQQYLASDAVKLRGTFPGMDRYLKNLIPFTTEEGIGYVLIADGIQDRLMPSTTAFPKTWAIMASITSYRLKPGERGFSTTISTPRAENMPAWLKSVMMTEKVGRPAKSWNCPVRA